ncbi:MAG: CrcB family protein, partial [Mycobacteriales bacterium]
MLTLGIALAAGIGAVCRYALDQVVAHRSGSELPYGTFVINVLGSLLLGLVLGLQVHHGLGSGTTLVVGAGFAGGFTTLSTWAWETLSLVEEGNLPVALWNVGASFTAGLLAAAAG